MFISWLGDCQTKADIICFCFATISFTLMQILADTPRGAQRGLSTSLEGTNEPSMTEVNGNRTLIELSTGPCVVAAKVKFQAVPASTPLTLAPFCTCKETGRSVSAHSPIVQWLPCFLLFFWKGSLLSLNPPEKDAPWKSHPLIWLWVKTNGTILG